MKSIVEKFVEKSNVVQHLTCEHEIEFNNLGAIKRCRNCEYFYYQTNSMYNAPRCLQEQIKIGHCITLIKETNYGERRKISRIY